MLCKYSLVIDSILYELPVSSIKNWDEISYTLKRQDYGGVIRSFASKFSFVDKAYELLFDEYTRNYLNASATIVVYTINDCHNYEERFRCELDFGTLVYDGNLISISAIDNSLASIIKAKKGTQYEYEVNAISENHSLYYDRLAMQNVCNFTIEDTYVLNPLELAEVYVSSFNNEIAKGGYIEYDKNEKGVVADIIEVPESGLNINVDMNVEYLNGGSGEYITITLSSCGKTQNIIINQGESSNVKLDISVSKDDFNSYSGRKMVYFSISLKASETTYAKFNIKKINEFKILYQSRNEPIFIEVIKPSTVLNKLLYSMNGEHDGFIGEIICGNSTLKDTVIVAAESVRGLPNAKLFTSFRKFEDWMSAEFGFVPVIKDNKVSFVHRDSLYSEDIMTTLDDVVNFEYSVEESLIYSQVRVGYDKQDYDSINGRDEFRFLNEYTTGVTLTDNKLEIISPYRADTYGIEFLAQKRKEDTTDNKSDNDVFIIGAKLVSKYSTTPEGTLVISYRYELIRDGYILSGIISRDTMFNAMYSPRSMVEANKRFIGISVSSLKFASSDGNSDVVINGIKESTDFDFDIEDRLFTVGKITAETYKLLDVEDFKGLVRLTNSNHIYYGYINDVDSRFGRYEGTKYKLLAKGICL